MPVDSCALPGQVSRRGLLLRGAGAGVSLVGLGAIVAPSAAADAVPDEDLAYLRLLIGVELLKVDYGSRAIAARRLPKAAQAIVTRLVLDDRSHYDGLAALLTQAGQTPATGGDIDFTYPRGSFASPRAIAKLGSTLSMLALGAYLGAVENVQTASIRLPLAQIAANEAQQAAAFAQTLGRRVVGSAFAPSLQIDAVSRALDRYES